TQKSSLLMTKCGREIRSALLHRWIRRRLARGAPPGAPASAALPRSGGRRVRDRFQQERVLRNYFLQPAEVPLRNLRVPLPALVVGAALRFRQWILLERIRNEIEEHAVFVVRRLVADHLIGGVSCAYLVSAVGHQIERFRQQITLVRI